MMSQIVEIFLSFFLIGLGAYGGGIVVIPLIEREIVLNHAWLSAAEFAQVISLSQMTPGPIAINAATFVGFMTGGVLGSAVATIGVVTPSVILMTLIIYLLKCMKDNCHIDRIRQGIRPGVLALIILAVISIGKVAVHNHTTLIIALVTFFLLYFFKKKVHPILTIILAGIAGLFVL
jgi:chromate transporter